MKPYLPAIFALIVAALSQGVRAEISEPDPITVNLPEFGKAEVAIMIVPASRPQVAVSQSQRTVLSFEMGEAGPPDLESAMQPKGQIAVRAFDGLPFPAIVVHIRSYYGTGYLDHIALIAEIHGNLKLLHEPWQAHNLGGIYVGPLSDVSASGVAEWNFEWADCHACPNPYKIVTYKWNAKSLQFEKEGVTERTEKRYDDPNQAIHERHPTYSNFIDKLPAFNE